MRGRKWYRRIFVSSVILTILLNLLSLIPGVSDWYAMYIFPVFNNTIGRISGLFPFSVGEILIAGGIFCIAAAFFFLLFLPFLSKHEGYRHFVAGLYRCLFLAFAWCCLLDTLTFYMLRGCSKMQAGSEHGREERQYSVGELASLNEYLAGKCNELSEQLERDETGRVLYSGDYRKEAKQAMRKLARKNRRLQGFYPDAKPVVGSVFMSYTNTAGVFFNMSMEANYNRQMNITQIPQVLCHEYAHFKGYLYEDEAEFIGYLACLESDDPLVRYSGYLSMWEYVDAACKKNMSAAAYDQCSNVNDLVKLDTVWLDDPHREKREEHPQEDSGKWLETTLEEHKDTIGKASRNMVDLELKLYGASDGIASYSRVVELLLEQQFERGKIDKNFQNNS